MQKSGDKLNAILVGLESGNFADSNVNRRRNDARFRELSLKVYETKIQPVCYPITQILLEHFHKNYQSHS